MLRITYEIHTTSGEILADGLSFDDLPIIFQAYQEWYGADSVIACYRTLDGKKYTAPSRRDEFYTDWCKFVDYLVTLNNI